MENCYILYSCDGSFEPILSNLNSLSGYSGEFVTIIVNSPGEPTTTCFYVQYFGQLDCDIVYDITIDPDTQCDCDTFCYFVQYDETPKQTIYVDNGGNVIVESFPTGQTVNFCSRIYPIFDTTGNTPVQIVNSCVGNNCPTTLPSIARSNECDVITIFPMGVECIVNNPTNSQTFDGSAQLYITGGTPPYTIFWEIGSYAPALTNLGVGTYNATVTDFYGDFIIDTTCVLEAEILSYSAMCFEVRGKGIQGTQYVTSQFGGIKNTKPYYVLSLGLTSVGIVFWDGLSETWVFCTNFTCNSNQFFQSLDNSGDYPISSISNQWSAETSTTYTILSSTLGECDPPVPVITYGNLCANFVINNQNPDQQNQQLQVQLIYDGNVNGKPTWQSADDQYYIYWNTGSTPNQWILTGQGDPSTTSIVNNYPTAPPLSNWQILGNGNVESLTIVSGNCVSATTVNFNVSKNDASCDDSGTIMINAYGGIAPFQYSIDNGTTYSNVPYFQNLSPGSYNVIVVDDNNNVSQQIITILGGPVTIYQLGFAFTNNGNFSVVAPQLPTGVTISFDLVQTSTLSYYPVNVSPTPQYNNTVTIVGFSGLSLYNTITSFSVLSGPCSLITPTPTTQITRIYKSNFTLSSTQTISGTTTNQVLFVPAGQCQGAQGTFQIQLANVKMNGCDCCEVEIVNF